MGTYRTVEVPKDHDLKWMRFSILLIRKHHLSTLPISSEDVHAFEQELAAEQKPVILVIGRGEIGIELSLRKRWQGSRVVSGKEKVEPWGIYAIDTPGIKTFALMLEKLGDLLARYEEMEHLCNELSAKDCPTLVVIHKLLDEEKRAVGFDVVLSTYSEARKMIDMAGASWKN